ncbi:MAG: hypothetical protein ACI4SP_05130 [Eubacteriales bacterium]
MRARTYTGFDAAGGTVDRGDVWEEYRERLRAVVGGTGANALGNYPAYILSARAVFASIRAAGLPALCILFARVCFRRPCAVPPSRPAADAVSGVVTSRG